MKIKGNGQPWIVDFPECSQTFPPNGRVAVFLNQYKGWKPWRGSTMAYESRASFLAKCPEPYRTQFIVETSL